MKVKPPGRHRRKRPSGGVARHGFVLKLFITGMTSHSLAAISSIKKICEQHLSGQYELEIVDLYRQPARAKKHQIVAAPTLIKEQPLPMRRMVGNMSDEARVMDGLNVKKK
ncbi:MAG TPA: circadian clock KaiB family protein [Verrucomicrobiae bacterium]|nr:circadian clock KaiB family protein [Verrucomicrobiae bacterium]